ncbi:ArsA family ATPase, partial [Corynebacterium kefirresidentii]
MLLETAPIMFFGGKGGVGKTTLATATALRLSRDHRVCLVSTDPAHNLGHIFGTALGDAPVALTPSLSAIEIDPARATEQHLAQVGSAMRRFMPEHLHGEVTKHLDLARQSPGTQEAALLERIAALVGEESDVDFLIFDTAPSGHTSRLMALPEIMAAYTDGLLSRREKSDKFGSLVRGMSPGNSANNDPVDRRNQEIRATLFQRRERFSQLRAALT